jgi:hypothetical protein
MSLSGFISLDRALLGHWCAGEPEALSVWVRLLLDANFADKKTMFNGALIEIKRGQLIFGYPSFSAKSGVSVAKLRRIIKTFEDDGMISRQKTNKYTLISITYYDKYQSSNRQNAGKSQADDKQIAGKSQHRNNDNKVNNDNNKNKASSTQLAIATDVQAEFHLPTNRFGTHQETFAVTTDQIELWSQSYQAVDVRSEIRKIIAWLDANDKKRKTHGGMKRFVSLWLSRCQDKGGNSNSKTGHSFGPESTNW